MSLSDPAIRVERRAVPRTASTPLVPVPPRVPARRRAVVGCAWALGWTLAWGLAIEGYSHRAQARPQQAAVTSAPADHAKPLSTRGRR